MKNLLRAGATLVVPSDQVHIGRNLGTTTVVLYVLPAGPLSQDAANPGCDFE